MSQSQTKFAPAQWFVTVSAADHITGKSVCLVQHQCSSRLHGSTLLTELRDVLDDLAALVPGLTVTGYEVAEAVEVPNVLAALSVHPAMEERLGEALPAGRNAVWWARASGQGRPREEA